MSRPSISLFLDLDAYSLELLPASLVGQAYHEMVVAGVYVVRDGDVYLCLIRFQARRDSLVLIIYPGLHGRLLLVERAVASRSGMGMVVEVVVYLYIEIAELYIIRKGIAESDGLAPLVLLAIYRVGQLTVHYLRLLPVADLGVVVIT